MNIKHSEYVACKRRTAKSNKKIPYILLGYVLIVASSTVQAISLSGQYIIDASATSLGPNSYLFEYNITNIDQEISGASYYTGLDGFSIQVPQSALISNITVPYSYNGSIGYWDGLVGGTEPTIFNSPEASLLPGNMWLSWGGYHTESVYPIGTTAYFSFQADNVNLGTASGVPVTFWNIAVPNTPYVTASNGANYTAYSIDIIAPTAVPVPATIWLLVSGLIGLFGIRKRANRVRLHCL